MLPRSIFSTGQAAVADPWSHDGLSSGPAGQQDSLKQRLLSANPPGSPQSSSCSSSGSGELIATVVPSEAAAAADDEPGAWTKPKPQLAKPAAAGLSIEQQPGAQELAVESFEQLCNDGTSWSWANWKVKLYRWMLLYAKQIYLMFLAFSVPTNHLMLTFRTFIRDAGEPNGNGDFLAAKFRDELMPTRGRLHRQKSPLISISRWFLELPFLGIPGIVRFIDVRTQWFDDSVNAAMRDGIKQVVIIAAGYDTRAYRLAKPGVRFFEIDLPHASKHKQELVRKLLPASKFPRPEFVAADLSRVKLEDALATTSFNPKEPALFTIEGLVYYLPAGAVQQLLSSIENISAPRSRITMDFLHLSSLCGSVWHPGFETLWISVLNKGERMHSGIDERPAAVQALMRKFGFHTHMVLTARDLVKQYMPHVQYKSAPPTVSPYFGYVSAEKM